MDYKTYKIRSEVDFHRLINQLKEEEIPHHYNMLGDSAIPPINFNKCYGEITIPMEFNSDFLKFIITENIEFEEKREARQTWDMPKVFFIVLIIYSMIMTLLFVKYLNLEKQYSFDKNFHYRWNWDNTVLSVIDKKTNNTITTFIDKNRDFNYELVRNFPSVEGIMIESIDRDENGYFEKIVSFGVGQRQSDLLIDNNGDGLYEVQWIYLENGDTLMLTDENKNGLFELN